MIMSNGYFITGTDTDCGKTAISCALMHLAQKQGQQVVGMKPVAAGAQQTSEGLRNDDALAIQRCCTHATAYKLINPVCFERPVAPHLQVEGNTDLLTPILAAYQQLRATADVIIVEGAGGWRVPVSEDTDIAELCLQMQLPVILVVGLRLGCINHALLSVEAIERSGARLAGWVANQIDPDMLAIEENISTLQARIKAPLLGTIPFLDNFSVNTITEILRE